ncbi:MAG: efflux RND transporter periplasmic adaptor subunit [Hyphomicrobium sp.]|nr:efflux RND transporter periplasmic adaptor subunit [Hyphomicrobium sp.]
MKWTIFLLAGLVLLSIGAAIGYRELGKSCASADVEHSEHAHDEAKKTGNTEGLTVRVCEVGLVGAFAERVGFGGAVPVVKPKVGSAEHKEHQEAAKAIEHGHKEGEADEEELVSLSPDQIREFKIKTETAAEGPVTIHIERPAEVRFNGNRVAHVVPRVPGVVSRVEVSEGESIEQGQLMAILESRELADAKANYLAVVERRKLASEALVREERLWKQKVSAEKEYLTARTELAEADIRIATAEQKLRALGLPARAIKTLSLNDENLTEYRIVTPQSGIVTERHLTLGEAVGIEREVFIVADLSTVWIDVTIYPRDVASIKPGQRVEIELGGGDPVSGKIEFVTPEVKEATRTAVARVVVDNASGRLRPGMFVTAQVQISQELAPVRVPRSAVQRQDNKSVVYVEHEGAFAPRPVKLGRENHNFVEVVAGLQPGETYVSSGGFVLKAQLAKESFGEGHGH